MDLHPSLKCLQPVESESSVYEFLEEVRYRGVVDGFRFMEATSTLNLAIVIDLRKQGSDVF